MTAEHGHSAAEITDRLSNNTKTVPLRDVVYGAIDGTITTFAIVAGVQGAGLSSSIIVALGIANVLADGFSMAASNYSGTKADLDDRNRIRAIEYSHIREFPEGEREELRQILMHKGLTGDVLEVATDAIAENSENWVNLMITDEYGLAPIDPNPMSAALTTFFAFLCAGIIPLLPFLLKLDDPFTVSIIITGIVFFCIGTGKSYWSLTPWWRSGLETLIIGTIAATVAFGVGSLFHI